MKPQLENTCAAEVVLREETEDGTQLVFPSAFRRDLASAAEPWGDRQLKLRRS